MLASAGWAVKRFWFGRARTKDTSLVGAAKRTTLRISVQAKGTFMPKNITCIYVGNMTPRQAHDLQSGGRYRGPDQGGMQEVKVPLFQLQISKVVPEGTRVKKDDIIVEFDMAPLDDYVAKMGDALNKANTSVDKLKNDLEFEKTQLDYFIRLDDGNIQNARKELERYQEDYPRELKAQQIALEQVKLNLKTQKNRLIQLYEQIDSGQTPEDTPQLETMKLELERIGIDIENKEKALKVFAEYTIPQEILKRQSECEKTEATKEKDKRDGSRKMDQIQADVDKATKDIEMMKKNLKNAEDWRTNMVIKAPGEGLVLYGGSDPEWGWTISPAQIKEKSTVQVGSPILNLPGSNEMKVVLQLSESEVKKIAKDLVVEIQPEAFADLLLPGKVTKVSEMAREEWNYGGDQQASTAYPVELECDKNDERIKPKMVARVTILIEEIPNVVCVPIEAVFEKDKKTYCYVPGPEGAPLEKALKVGKSNDDYVIVTEGLADGEKVFLHDPFLEKK
jgi:HlyD family secretion protein